MLTRTKLVLLELIAGLFGWTWLIAGAFAIYFLIMALAFNGSWKPIIAAVLVGGIAKWLAKGFADHKNRVAIKADLVKKGLSPQDAREALMKPYVGSDARQATAVTEEKKGKSQERLEIISDYGRFLEHNPTIAIRDVKLLPHDKQTILDAICWEIVDQRDDARLKSLRDAALFLADFAEGVGDEPLFLLGTDLSSSDPAAATVEELMAIAGQIAEDPNRERYESFEKLVQTSEDDIFERLAVAEMLRQEKLGNSKPAS
jgi:hypothetical protein